MDVLFLDLVIITYGSNKDRAKENWTNLQIILNNRLCGYVSCAVLILMFIKHPKKFLISWLVDFMFYVLLKQLWSYI